MTRSSGLLLLLAVLAAGGCGREVVGGGVKEVDAVAVSDGGPQPSRSAGAAHATVPLSRASLAASKAGLAQGTVSFDTRVALVGAGGEVVELTRSPVGAQVRIEGTDTARVAREEVRATTYTRARITFTRVTANVTGGLVVGGVSLTGRVDVAIAPGDSVVVEAPVNLSGSAKQTLVIDLNASQWLSATSLVTRTVAPSTFRSAVEVRVR